MWGKGKFPMSKKSNPNFRDITCKVEENVMLHEIFREVSRFPRYNSCSIGENPYLWDSVVKSLKYYNMDKD